MISIATSSRGVVNGRIMKLDVIGVIRACFHAPAIRQVYVILPPEDTEPGMCGRLNQAKYRTRDAAYKWGVAST